jgi:hypothetical protein
MSLFGLSSIQEWHNTFHQISKEYNPFDPSAALHFAILGNLMKEINTHLQSATTSAPACLAAAKHFEECIHELQENKIIGSSLEDAIMREMQDVKLILYELSYNYLKYTYPTLITTSEHRYEARYRVHYAIEVFQKKYPSKKQEDYWEEEYKLRHLVKSRIFPQYPPNVTKGWPERVIPHDHPNTWPIRTKHVVIPAIIELYRRDLVTRNTEYPPPVFPLNIWWSAEDAHIHDPIGTWVLVWREWDSDQIHEGWIQRIAPYIDDSKLTWQHWQTCYPANTISPLPLISS